MTMITLRGPVRFVRADIYDTTGDVKIYRNFVATILLDIITFIESMGQFVYV